MFLVVWLVCLLLKLFKVFCVCINFGVIWLLSGGMRSLVLFLVGKVLLIRLRMVFCGFKRDLVVGLFVLLSRLRIWLFELLLRRRGCLSLVDLRRYLVGMLGSLWGLFLGEFFLFSLNEGVLFVCGSMVDFFLLVWFWVLLVLF